MPIAPSLQQFVDGELARSATLIEQAARDILTQLRHSGGAVTAAADAHLHGELAVQFARHVPLYRATFVDSLASRVRDEFVRDDVGAMTVRPSGLADLSLMDESRVEIDIGISRATELIDAAADWELRELQTFTSTLAGQTHVSAESNPLRPTLYAAALWDAACVVHPGQPQRAELLRLSAIACAPLLKKAWAAASTRLEADGVTPGIYRSLVLPSGSTRPAPADPTPGNASTALRRLVAAMPGSGGLQVGAERFAEAPAPRATAHATDAALAQLDAILGESPAKGLSKLQAAALTARLDVVRSALLAAGTAGVDAKQVVEMLSQVFDVLLTDPDLHPAFVTVVARLQIPALRLALRDAPALASAEHPVWRLLDRIGEASASYPQAGDSRAAGLLKLATRLTDELIRQTGGGAELCRKALAKLDEYLAAQLQAQRRVAGPQIRLLVEAERRQTLEAEIAQRLADQMAPLRTMPSVRGFLCGPWARVLANALMHQTEDQSPARDYIRLVDDLLWSVQSPDHPASRQRLAALLPPMLDCLRDGMASIALPEGEQRAILDELRTVHNAALQRGEGGDPVARGPAAGDALRAQVPPDASRAAAHEAMIDVASLETVPAGLMPTGDDVPAGDGPSRHVAALRPADRARLFVNGRWSRVQLLWRSDRGEFLLFVGETLGETHSITRRALERLATAGLLRPLEDLPLSERAIRAVERRLAGASAGAR